ncbi:MAG: DUF4402 domain-containing protein [bacterium]
MKKLLALTGLGLLLVSNVHATDQSFSVALKLYKPITITKVQDLSFPDTTLTGSAFDITVATIDSGAATFNAQGGKNRNITRSIVESSINMSAPGVTGNIAVNTFSISGPTAFDSSGNANGLKVGAVAHVLAASEDGTYTGTATFRVVYQ